MYAEAAAVVAISKIKFCVSWYGAVGASENHFKSTHVATPQLAGHAIRKYADWPRDRQTLEHSIGCNSSSAFAAVARYNSIIIFSCAV